MPSEPPKNGDLPDYAAPAPQEPPPRALLTIFFIVFMDLFGFGIIIPLLPFYVHDAGTNPMKVGLLFSIYSICQFIGAPILGMISDRHGRRPVLAFSQAGSVVGYVLLGVATQFHWHNVAMALWLVYLSRVIDGFTGGNISTAQAYIADVTTPQNRARGMGVLGAAFGMGFALGPFVGGVLSGVHVSLPAYVAAGFSAIAAIMSVLWLTESRQHSPTDAEAWLHPSRFLPILRKPILLQLLLMSLFTMAAFVMMESMIGIYLFDHYNYSPRKVGWFFGYIGIVIAIVQGGFIRRLTHAVGDWIPSIIGPLIVGVSMLGYASTALVPRGAWIAGLVLLLIVGATNAIGRSIQQPTLSSLISRFSRKGEQGTVFGLYHGLGSIARILGPLLAGATFRFWHNTAPFITSGVISVACGFWMLTLFRQHPVEEQADGMTEAYVETA